MQSAAQVIPFDARSCGGARSSDRLLVVDQQLAFVRFARLVARRMGYETGVVLDSLIRVSWLRASGIGSPPF